MAIHIMTSTPRKLLRIYKEAIDEKKVATWSYDKDGDFTHTADQWVEKAWLRPKITENEKLSLYIICPKNSQLSKTVYAVYHGRFIESILTHCDELFKQAYATALPESSDRVKS